MKQMQRLLREPLLHFLAIGGMIFALFAAMSDPTPTPVNTIVIGPARIEQLSKGFQAAWRRPPSAGEFIMGTTRVQPVVVAVRTFGLPPLTGCRGQPNSTPD